MNARRLWIIGGVLVIGGILALGWFILVSPMYTAAGRNDESRAAVELQNGILQAEVAALSEVDVEALRGLAESASRRVPDQFAQDELLRELAATVARADAAITGVSFGEAAPFLGPPPRDPAAEEDPAPLLPVAASDLAAVAEAGLVVVPLTITISGDQAAFLAALTGLGTIHRLLVISGADWTAALDGGTGTVTGSVFVLPPGA